MWPTAFLFMCSRRLRKGCEAHSSTIKSSSRRLTGTKILLAALSMPATAARLRVDEETSMYTLRVRLCQCIVPFIKLLRAPRGGGAAPQEAVFQSRDGPLDIARKCLTRSLHYCIHDCHNFCADVSCRACGAQAIVSVSGTRVAHRALAQACQGRFIPPATFC